MSVSVSILYLWDEILWMFGEEQVLEIAWLSLNRLSSSIFCCLSVSLLGTRNTQLNLHLFKYIQAYKPYFDPEEYLQVPTVITFWSIHWIFLWPIWWVTPSILRLVCSFIWWIYRHIFFETIENLHSHFNCNKKRTKMIYIETYAVLSFAKVVAIFAFLVCKIFDKF